MDYAKTRQKLIGHLRELGASAATIGVAMDTVSQTGWPNAGTRPQFPGVCLVVESPYGQLIFCCDKFSVWTHNLRAIVETLESAHKMVALGAVHPQHLYAAFQDKEMETWLASGAFTAHLGRPHIPAANTTAKKAKTRTETTPNPKARAAAPPPSSSRPTAPPPPRTPPRNSPPKAAPTSHIKETFDTRAQAVDWLAAQTGTSRSHIMSTEEVFLSVYRKAARSLHPDVGGDPAQFRRLQNAKETIERGTRWPKAAQ